MPERRSWAAKRGEIMSRLGAGTAYAAARIRFELGDTVRNRRMEVGMTQEELARRTGLKQPAVARLEVGGTMPTIPVLERVAAALDMRLDVRFEPLREAG